MSREYPFGANPCTELNKTAIMKIEFSKYSDGLAPAIIQDFSTGKVLMLGFMNEEALKKTMAEGKVTFFSRSKQRLWTKGEESGHFLLVKQVMPDCDNDTLLIKAQPLGPTCHTGADTCWSERNHNDNFLFYLEDIIRLRKAGTDENSYVKKMFAKGLNKIAQKVGEEAVEMVIEAKDNNDELFLNESADLLFHYLLLLNAKGHNLQDVLAVLQKRHSK
ncbi:MAG: bifunctional phosphoribosyl-AMP cyclohydrolase/phosphoribosyl-ATP diphosphatase HisIE [Bacteroidota bacterium]|nr:bifunctional phosphoribosyl-AMP cyclohydrolase/phosphoribosyl-ATP diphosphatase HisIE [Bacteroidota bacterium]